MKGIEMKKMKIVLSCFGYALLFAGLGFLNAQGQSQEFKRIEVKNSSRHKIKLSVLTKKGIWVKTEMASMSKSVDVPIPLDDSVSNAPEVTLESPSVCGDQKPYKPTKIFSRGTKTAIFFEDMKVKDINGKCPETITPNNIISIEIEPKSTGTFGTLSFTIT